MATSTKKNTKIKFKKAPGAPRRFKSAYMFFSESMHKVLRLHVVQNKKIRAAEVAKMVSQNWKNLTDEERAPWIEMGRKDRERYEVEKAAYTGPWKVPATTPVSAASVKGAPKKPQSAFLAFSNQRRKALAAQHPHLTGTQISTLLSQMWKDSSDEVKQPYREREARERASYKLERAAWEAQVQTEMLAAAATNAAVEQAAWQQQQQQVEEELPQAPQCISSLYTALENELRSFQPAQHVPTTTPLEIAPIATNTAPAKPLTLERMPQATTTSSSFATTLFGFSSSGNMLVPKQQPQPKMCTAPPAAQQDKLVGQHNFEFEAWPVQRVPVMAPAKSTATNAASCFDDINYSLDDLLQCEELLEDFAPQHGNNHVNHNTSMDDFTARLAMVAEVPTTGSCANLPNIGSCSSLFA